MKGWISSAMCHGLPLMLGAVLVLCGAAPAPTSSSAVQLSGLSPVPPSTAPAEKFELSVKFSTGFRLDHELKTTITLDQPFLQKDSQEKGGYHLASGMLLPPVDGKYPLVLTFIEWQSEVSNNMGATKLNMTVGKPESWGVSAGLVRIYTVTLTRADKEGASPAR